MKTQISDEEFVIIEDRVYRALELSFAVARHLGLNNETAQKKYGPKCGWIHFSIAKNYINRGSRIGREFTKSISAADVDIFGKYEIGDFIEKHVKGIDKPGGGDGRFIVDLHDKVVELLTIASLSGDAKNWMRSGLERFHKDMTDKAVLDLS
jgi:hypothetical protein